MVHEAWVIDKLTIPCFKVSKRRVTQQGNHLSDVNLPELDGHQVVILIFGADMAHLLIHLKFRQGRQDEPIPVKIPFGWTLLGNVDQGHCQTNNANFSHQKKRSHCNIRLNDFGRSILMGPSRFSLSPPCLLKTKERCPSLKAAQSRRKATTKQHCYRNMNQPCITITAMQLSRLHSIKKKLKRNPELAKKYQNVITSYVT